jgi:predicted transcriptional regulator of viral defense system
MTSQSFTRRDTEIIKRARRKRRSVLVLDEDREWLREFAAEPRKLLSSMAQRGALIRLGAGRYAVPDLGAPSAAYRSWQPLVHARLAPLGDYYVGFLSALSEHRLTDISDKTVTAAVNFGHRQLIAGEVSVAGRRLRVVRSDRRVFDDSHGIETGRLSRVEVYRRSNPTRTLVDALWHPELCGSTELWATCWGRAARTDVLDVEAACAYGQALGSSVARRVGLMLDLTGHADAALEMLPQRVRRADRVVGIDAAADVEPETPVDPLWKVSYNVPRDRLEGWVSYGK